MHGLGGMAGLPFVILAHVNQYGLGIGGKFRARLGDADFVHGPFGFGHELEKTG